jgi:hypothetical protein
LEIQVQEYDRAVAHYLWPPRFVGEEPYWERTGQQPPPDPKVFGEVVATASLPGGVRVRAFRDGMVAFAMGDATPAFEDPRAMGTDALVEWHDSAVRLANAHIACLAAVRKTPYDTPSDVASLWSVMQVDFESGEFHASNERMTGGTRVALWTARREPVFDWRAYRGRSLITKQEIERSFDLLSDLLDRLSNDAVVLRAGMLARALNALNHRDWTGALMSAWIATEGMLGDLFRRYLDQQKGREQAKDVYGNDHQFIEQKRRGWLLGSDMTVRHTVEALSLLDELPFETYLACTACAKARNDWAHYETEPKPEIAALAVHALGEMFQLVEGVPLRVFPEESN